MNARLRRIECWSPGIDARSKGVLLGIPGSFARRGPWDATREGREVNPEVRRYLNRLSDLVFVLARRQAGEDEPTSR